MYRITLVLDEHCGPRLIELVRSSYVWAVQSAENGSWAKRIWSEPMTSADPELFGLSTFARLSDETLQEMVVRVLDLIDEHHGEYAHSPAWSEIEVIGAAPTAQVAEAARGYGVDTIEQTPEGFCLKRTAPTAA